MTKIGCHFANHDVTRPALGSARQVVLLLPEGFRYVQLLVVVQADSLGRHVVLLWYVYTSYVYQNYLTTFATQCVILCFHIQRTKSS